MIESQQVVPTFDLRDVGTSANCVERDVGRSASLEAASGTCITSPDTHTSNVQRNALTVLAGATVSPSILPRGNTVDKSL